MSMRKFKTKYCELGFHEDHNGQEQFYWASVGMAWGEKSDPTAIAFATLMDGRLLDQARILLKDAVKDPVRDIYLEDVDLLVNLDARFRHIGARLIGLVQSLELEFDSEIEKGRTLEVK